MPIAARPFGELLEALAERTPAPGGGTAAACAGALAAGLVEMAARFSNQGDPGRASELRGQLLELAEVELTAYEPLLEALRLPRDDPERAGRIAAARSHAARSPLEIARASAEVAALASELVRDGNRNLEGDANTARLLASAACRAAARLVELNLPDQDAEAMVSEARQLVARVHPD